MTHSDAKRKRILILTLSVLALILLGGIVCTVVRYQNGAFEQGELLRRLWYAVLCIAMIAAVFLAELLFRIRFPLALEVSLMAFAVAALCGGNLYDLYGALPFWDKILHTLSGPLFSIVGLSFALLLLRDMPEGTGKVLAAVLFALLFSLAVGYLWEVFEYAVDSLMPGGYNNQRWQNGVVGQLPNGNYEVTEPRGSGLIDTMSDLICNLCGAAAFVIHYAAHAISRRSLGFNALIRDFSKGKKPAHAAAGTQTEGTCGGKQGAEESAPSCGSEEKEE